MSNVKTACVTGANRGIGHEFAKQLSNNGWMVIAGYREESKSKTLLTFSKDNNNLCPFKIDVTDASSLVTLRDYIKNNFESIDLLINNAGVLLEQNSSLDDDIADDLMESFRINVLGAHLTTTHLQEFLKKGKSTRIVNIGTRMASISLASSNAPAYRISKTALNMLTRMQSIHFAASSIVTVVMHPGWVQTDMGGKSAALSAKESVTSMLSVIDGLTSNDNGKYLNYDGTEIPY